MLFIWKGEKEREREKEKSNYWFTSKMLSTAMAKPGQSQEPGTQSSSPLWVGRHSATQATIRGLLGYTLVRDWFKAQEAGSEPGTSTWDRRTPSQTPAPIIVFKCLQT